MEIGNLAKEILEAIGGGSNITNIENCMTRVRLNLKNEALFNQENVKAIDGVQGIVKAGDQFQIVVGPGTAAKTVNYIKENLLSGDIDAKQVKAQIKQKYQGKKINTFFRKIGNIFIPIIPAFIGCGLIIGITNLLKISSLSSLDSFKEFILVISILGSSIFSFMYIIVGFNTAKEFGGTPIVGAVLASILYLPDISKILVFGNYLVAGKGGILGVLLVVIVAAKIENFIRKFVPDLLDLILVPFLTIFIAGFLALFVLNPLCAVLSNDILLMINFLLEKGGFLTGAIIAGSFLPIVMTGLHQGLIPIMADMLAKLGANNLLPILAMAGAGQVGAGFAVFLKTKNKKLKNIAKSSLLIGILGIGEPLIYGVTLPLFRPFIAACIGGAFGGAVTAVLKVSAIVPGGISGVLLIPSIVSSDILYYIIGLIVAYFAGFIFTIVLKFKDIK